MVTNVGSAPAGRDPDGSGPHLWVLRRPTAEASRLVAHDLLCRAGRLPEPVVAGWAAGGDIYTLAGVDSADDEVLGAALVMPVGASRLSELRILAIATAAPNVTARLLEEVADALRRRGRRELVAMVSKGEPSLHRLLLARGFRARHIQSDHLTSFGLEM